MFTGIVQAIGTIEAVDVRAAGRRLLIGAGALALDDVAIGDSIAVNGACMTVTAKQASHFSIDVSAESLDKTSGLDALGPVNLEKSLRLGERIDGHLVSGHVDGTGTVTALQPRGDSVHLEIDAPAALAPCLAYKGSITVHGVSLTINAVTDQHRDGVLWASRVAINLIPHTLAVTTLGRLRPGDRVNLEIDMLARYVQRMLTLKTVG